ncbi:MAG: pentapeptide repeat-containing protein, partial [Actinoallomurus sp.]
MSGRKRRLAEPGDVREQQRGDDDQERVFDQRFVRAAGRLGHAEAAVRLAGAYAMAGLADDWQNGRQNCIDELCAYLRTPYEPPPEVGPPAAEQLTFGGSQEIHHTIISIITAHLRDNARVSWQGHDFDFTGIRFDGGDFSDATFSGGTVDFKDATFSGAAIDFTRTTFSGATVDFTRTTFSGAAIDFTDATFSGGTLLFVAAAFSGGTLLSTGAEFSGATVHVVAADRRQGSLLTATASQMGAVQQKGGPGLAGHHHLAVGQQGRL